MYHLMIRNEFIKLMDLMKILSNDNVCIQSIENASRVISNSFKCGGKVLSCGNGGSHCHAMHFAEELTGRYRKTRVGYPAIAISDPSYLSCVSNDFGYENVFSRYVESVGIDKDVLFAISTSGRSANIIRVLKVACHIGMKVVLLTSDRIRHVDNYEKFISFVDVEICVPSFKYVDYIQDMHIKIIHIIVLLIEKEMLT